MTEKRFTFEVKIRGNTAYTQWYDNGKPISSAETLCELLNEFVDENEQLKERIKRHMEIELLKSEDYANCHNCKHNRSVHDGATLDGMCSIKGLMNLGGYFDTEYHNLPNRTICPCWELGK